MKRQNILLALLMLLVLLSACGKETTAPREAVQPEEAVAEITSPEETMPETPEEDAAPQEPAVEVFTAADMHGIDPMDPNLSVAAVDFSQQPHFSRADGLHGYISDCIANRCRSIVFSTEKNVEVDLDSSAFCETYLVAWAIPKMQPGAAGKQYIIRVTYYPGDNVAWAYQSGDRSTLEPEELELYDAAVDWLEANITEDMTDYDKCVAIHDYLAGNVRYDNELLAALNTSFTFSWGITAYGALIDHDSICQGYADAFKMLTAMLGMHSIQVYGLGSGAPHNWNMVELDGQWYHVDCTFDNMFGGSDCTCAKAYLFASDSQMRRTHSWAEDSYPAASDDSLYYYSLHDLMISTEEDLAVKVGETIRQGGQADVFVRQLQKKQVTAFVEDLGGEYHAADYDGGFVLCAWIP